MKTEKQKCTVCSSEETFIKELEKYKGVILFVGHGCKNQYKKEQLPPLFKKIDIIVENFHQQYDQQWIAVYGGDKNAGEQHPDIGYIMAYLKYHHCIPIAAVMGDTSLPPPFSPSSSSCFRKLEEKEDDENDNPWVDVMYYTKVDHDHDGHILYGGVYQGQLVGSTKIYLGDKWVSSSPSSSLSSPSSSLSSSPIKKPLLDHVVVIGGGDISFQEMKYAFEKKVPMTYLPAEINHQNHLDSDPLRKKYGPIHAWALEHKDSINILGLD